MTRFQIIQISDLHLSADRAYNYEGWEACLRYIERERPDFVAVTGDNVLDDPDREEDHAFARDELAKIPVPWAAVPGNHDIGDANPTPYMGQHVTEARLERYLHFFGCDRWQRDVGRWRLVGINSLLLGTGMKAEGEQSAWLVDEIAGHGGGPIALFLHKPLFLRGQGEKENPDWCLLAKGCGQLLELFRGADLRLVASGHTHHYRTMMWNGTALVWAPSTSQINSAGAVPFTGLYQPGLVHYWFDDEGLEFGLVRPQGIRTNDVAPLVARHGAMRNTPLLTLTDDDSRSGAMPACQAAANE